MESMLLDAAGHRRSPATMPGYHRGRPPRNKGEQYPADPPTVEEIVAVMRALGGRAEGHGLRATASTPVTARSEEVADFQATSRWARLGLNQRPLACEASALPLSYAPGGRILRASARGTTATRVTVAEPLPASV